MDVIPAWMIEELEKLRRETENDRPRLYIQDVITINPEEDKKDEETIIVINLR